jgi:hypothetical protein
VEPHLAARRLHVLAGAPKFSMPAYVVYPAEHDGAHFANALDIMHGMADPKTKPPIAARTPKGAGRAKR